jgi:hypothetical protein
MWLQPPPPVTNRWVLHIAAEPRQVDAVLRDLGIDEHARPLGDSQVSAYLTGRGSPYEPPPWMAFACAELDRRGHRSSWCAPACRHHPWPPRTEPQPAAAKPGSGRRSAPGGLRTPRRRLTSGVPHHRTPILTPRSATATPAQLPVRI